MDILRGDFEGWEVFIGIDVVDVMVVVGDDVVEGFAVAVVVIVVVVVVIVDVVIIFSAESKNHRQFLKISYFYVLLV